MKDGIFGTWFRELATLVLTQTVQAFLLAIVMGIVISAMKEATSSESGTNYAAGMLAIIALSQFGKIENLVKKIFGINSQFGGDMASGRGAFSAGTALALRGAKSLTDNGKKIFGGAKRNLEARSELKTLHQQRGAAAMLDAQDESQAQLAAEEDTNQQQRISDGTRNAMSMAQHDAVMAASGIDDGNTGAMLGGAAAGAAIGAEAASGVGTTISGGSLGLDAGQFATLIGAISNNTTAIQANHKTNGLPNGQGNDNPVKKRTDEIDAKIAEAEKRKKDSGREVRSGLAETAGAIQGAAIGATVGLGMGDKVAEYTLTGAGAGDTVGRKAAGAVHATHDVADKIAVTHQTRVETKQQVINSINQTIQNVQKTSITKAQKEAKASGKTLSEQEIKQIGENAAKNTYEKLKNDLSKGRTGSAGKDGKNFDELTKGKNPVNKVKGAVEKGKVKKLMKEGSKGISDISNL